MGEIRRERSQERRRRLLAGGSRWALAAAALLAIGFGISRLGTGGTGSSGSAGGSGAQGAAKSGALPLGVLRSTADSRTYSLPAAAAKRALGLPARMETSSAEAQARQAVRVFQETDHRLSTTARRLSKQERRQMATAIVKGKGLLPKARPKSE